jgi:hypothetical protein
MSRRLMQLSETEVWEDLQLVSLTLWQLLKFQHGVMELDTITEYSNN